MVVTGSVNTLRQVTGSSEALKLPTCVVIISDLTIQTQNLDVDSFAWHLK